MCISSRISTALLRFAMDATMQHNSNPHPPKHLTYMTLALDCARRSPSKPSNFRVGAVLVDIDSDAILATGYTLELPGNTHAEQCCLIKYASEHDVSEEEVGNVLPAHTVLYTTMEPCTERLSGNLPCVMRILRTRERAKSGIQTVYLGVKEPDTFVQGNDSTSQLERAGVKCIHVPGLEEEILRVATLGHVK